MRSQEDLVLGLDRTSVVMQMNSSLSYLSHTLTIITVAFGTMIGTDALQKVQFRSVKQWTISCHRNGRQSEIWEGVRYGRESESEIC